MHLATRPPLRRMLVLDQAVRAGRYPNSTTLAGELEVNSRTVQRDIEFMRDSLAAPLAFCRRRNGYYYSDPDYRLPFFQLSEGELVALFLAERMLRQFRGAPFEDDLQRAIGKIMRFLPEEVSIDLAALSDALSVIPGTVTRENVEVFHVLAQAAAKRRRVEIDYWTASRDEQTRRLVDPYHLARINHDWYLFAYCHFRCDVRTFSLARVRHARETGGAFARPADFNLDEYLAGSFRAIRGTGRHHVMLRFTPQVARRVAEKTWHPTQRLEKCDDGSLLVHFELNDLREVKSWVLSWGKECETLAPAELRKIIAQEISHTAMRYGNERQRRFNEALKVECQKNDHTPEERRQCSTQ